MTRPWLGPFLVLIAICMVAVETGRPQHAHSLMPADAAMRSSRVHLATKLFGTMSNNWNQAPAELPGLCTTFDLDPSECTRVARYLGSRLEKIKKKEEVIHVKTIMSTPSNINHDRVLALRVRDFLGNGSLVRLQGIVDMERIIQGMHNCTNRGDFLNASLLVSLGDATAGLQPCFPFLKKVRLADPELLNANMVLLPLNSKRHWGPVHDAQRVDIPFDRKHDRLVWRGASTGQCKRPYANGSRMQLMEKYASRNAGSSASINASAGLALPEIDVGISVVCQDCTDAEKYVKGQLSLSDMLESKFLLVASGNDKATALNWILHSNSVPFMVKPVFESWLLESSLLPWIHYIPIEADFSDIDRKLNWAIKHRNESRMVALRGRQYVEQFLRMEREARIEAAVLTAYLQRVKVTAAESFENPLSYDQLNNCRAMSKT